MSIGTDDCISDRGMLLKHGLINPVLPSVHVNFGSSLEEARRKEELSLDCQLGKGRYPCRWTT